MRLERLQQIGDPPIQVEVREEPVIEHPQEGDDEFNNLRELMCRVGIRCQSPRRREDRQHPPVLASRPRNRSSRKRFEYHKQQQLYSRDKAECLKYITDRAGYI